MIARAPQHHVAILVSQPTCLAQASCKRQFLRRRRAVLLRWQSTASKTVTTPEASHRILSSFEIPADCFVDSPSFPEPSLDRLQSVNQLDLSVTRPAVIESPPSLERRNYKDGVVPLSDRAKHLFKIGKSYLTFYKTGLKNIWSNSKTYQGIRNNLQGYSLNAVAKYGGQTLDGKSLPTISRAEYQLCLRTKHDLLKMLPFSLVFLICGEFTPLVIVALGTSVVPYTCRIPQQENKDLTNKLAKDKAYMQDLPALHPDLETPPESPDWRVEHLEAYRLGLTPIRKPFPVIGQLYHSLRTRPALVRYCDNLVSDTILIHRQGGAFKLSELDLYEWADRYGLYALRQHIEKCRETKKDPKTEKTKTFLLPKIEAEMKYMLHDVADWSRLKPNEQWRVALRTIGSNSPDWKARVKDMRQNWKQA